MYVDCICFEYNKLVVILIAPEALFLYFAVWNVQIA